MMKLQQVEKIIKEETVYQGKKINVKMAQTICPSGNPALREKVERRNGTAILALTEDNEVILEHNWRYAFKEDILCLPAGKTDSGESYLAAAKRELEEEAGIQAENWVNLGIIRPAPAYSDEEVGLFLATGLKEGKKSWDEDEYLLVEKVPFAEFAELIRDNRINDARTLLAYYRYLEYKML